MPGRRPMRVYAVMAVRRHRSPAPSARSAATPAVLPPGGYSVASTKFLEALRMCRLSRLLRSCTTKVQTTS